MDRYIEVDQSNMSVSYQQKELDTATPLINTMIKTSNAWCGLPTLDLASFIHHSKGRGGVYRTCSVRLHDGCHPDDPTRLHMASEIRKKLTNFVYAA